MSWIVKLDFAFGLRFRQRACGCFADRHNRIRSSSRAAAAAALERILSAFERNARSIRLEHVRRDLVRLLFQLLNRDEDRRAADRSRATAKRADAVLDDSGIAVNYSDVVDVDSQLIRGDLRERRFLSLAVR